MRMAARKSRRLRPAALLIWALALCGAPLSRVRAEPFLFFWDRPERQEPERAPGLTGRQVRGILAREGARMIGKPHLRGDEIIAVGQNRDGAQKRFTLDAISGEVLDVEIISGPPRRSRLDGPPERPLPPPQHAPNADDGVFGGAQDRTPVAPPPPKAEAPRQEAAPAPQKQSDDPDAALSPIKPLHPPGAPKVEPLPQQ